jgi:hypothetical protein
MRRNWWRMLMADHYPICTAATIRLLSLHATSAAAERNWSVWGRVYAKSRSSLKVATAERVIFISKNAVRASQQPGGEAAQAVTMDVTGMQSDDEE